jgi:hypothetical protein
MIRSLDSAPLRLGSAKGIRNIILNDKEELMEGPTLAQLQGRPEPLPAPDEVARLTGIRGWLVFMILRFCLLSVGLLAFGFMGTDGKDPIAIPVRFLSILVGLLHSTAVYMLLLKKKHAVTVARVAALLPPSLLYSWYFFVSKRVKYTYGKPSVLWEAKDVLQRKQGWQQ